MNCTGPCQQGRLKCPTPAACMIDEPETTHGSLVLDALLAVVLVVVVVVVCYVIVHL